MLGPLRVRTHTGNVDIGPPQRRAVLALTLSEVRALITAERLVECIWIDSSGRGARNSIHAHISHLRKAVGRETIISNHYGYALKLRTDQFDAETFSRWARQGRSLVGRGDDHRGRQQLSDALSLWRGRAYQDFDNHFWAQREIARLEAERLGALTTRLDADLRIGDTDVVGELEALAHQHPPTTDSAPASWSPSTDQAVRPTPSPRTDNTPTCSKSPLG